MPPLNRRPNWSILTELGALLAILVGAGGLIVIGFQVHHLLGWSVICVVLIAGGGLLSSETD